MLQLIYNNDYVTLGGDYDKNTLDIIVEECSYFVPQADWSDKYQTGVWDGKKSLFSKKNKTFPAGLLLDIKSKLEEQKIQFFVNDIRPKPIITKNSIVNLGEHTFRDYQNDSKKLAKEKERLILNLPTGAGKTSCSAGIISDISAYPVIFVVPSVSLLKQTAKEFQRTLEPLNDLFSIGTIGGGECIIAEHGVNVCTYQTLLTAYNKKYDDKVKKVVDIEDKTSYESLQKQLIVIDIDLKNSPKNRLAAIKKKKKDIENKIKTKEQQRINKKRIRDLVESCQLLIIDETHLAAVIIEQISLKCKKAYYKCGLSATPIRTDNQDKRMVGATGPILKRVSATDLINRGFLVKPYIYAIELNLPDKSRSTWQETYKNAIVLSEQRNNLIRDIATEMHNQGKPTMIMVERIEHGNVLQNLIPNCVFVPGDGGDNDQPISDTEIDYRRSQLNRLENNEIILCATSWSFTGLDAPKIECLILGCSVSSKITVLQQVGRVLRKAPGKDSCIIIDFKHKENNLRKHFSSRHEAYKSEVGFEVKIIKYNSKKDCYI